MPYGAISDDMREYLESRAKSDVKKWADRINFEPVLCETPNICEAEENCLCFVPGIFTISVIIEGALDEEWEFLSGGFEVNVCEWVAEKLRNDGVSDFHVLVSSD